MRRACRDLDDGGAELEIAALGWSRRRRKALSPIAVGSVAAPAAHLARIEQRTRLPAAGADLNGLASESHVVGKGWSFVVTHMFASETTSDGLILPPAKNVAACE